MASFAKLKPSNNVVLDVIKVGNDVPTSNGPLGDNDMHVDGETYCTNTFGGTWKQCSETNAFRKQNAGVGDTYDAVKDKFIVQQPHASWTLDANDDWQAPIAYPTILLPVGEEEIEHSIQWKESSQQWCMINYETQVVLTWNPETTSWF